MPDNPRIEEREENELTELYKRTVPSTVSLTLPRSENVDEETNSSTLGTGFFVDERGYILTNFHVVRNLKPEGKLLAKLYDGTSLSAHLINYNEERDLALLKINGGNRQRKFRTMTLGTDSDLEVGETVLAIGNPLGNADTLTCGIISALGRKLPVEPPLKYENMIQSQTPINPGNSGGPLMNIYGEVVGVNSAVRAESEGIAYAIPMDMARSILAKLFNPEEPGSVNHGLIARTDWKSEPNGLRVSSTHSGSAAREARLQPGDLILMSNGLPIQDLADWERSLVEVPAGDKVGVVVIRLVKGATREVPLVLTVRRNPEESAPRTYFQQAQEPRNGTLTR